LYLQSFLAQKFIRNFIRNSPETIPHNIGAKSKKTRLVINSTGVKHASYSETDTGDVTVVVRAGVVVVEELSNVTFAGWLTCAFCEQVTDSFTTGPNIRIIPITPKAIPIFVVPAILVP